MTESIPPCRDPHLASTERPGPLPAGLVLVRCGGIATPIGTVPGPLLLQIEHAGDPHRASRIEVRALGPAADAHADTPRAVPIDLGDSCLTPGFVNAHTHLDLTPIGPRPHAPAEGFLSWVGMIVRERATEPDAIADAVRLGIQLSLAAGVVAVGDIAGVAAGRWSIEPYRVLRDSPLAGVSFIEMFGFGEGEPNAIDRLATFAAEHAPLFEERAAPVRLGLQPHAPYSAGVSLYRAAAAMGRSGVPLATHLAETPEEAEFVGHATGPFRAFLAGLGLVTELTPLDPIGRGHHPVALLEPALAAANWLVAHANDAPDAAIGILAKRGAAVAFCPRASAYFGAGQAFGPHRYRDLRDAGVCVCLGTDSIVNLPPGTDRAEMGAFGPLDDARLLVARDGLAPGVALEMLTTAGASALGLRTAAFEIVAGASLAGLVAIATERPADAPCGGQSARGARADTSADAWADALRGVHAPRLLAACRDAAVPLTIG